LIVREYDPARRLRGALQNTKTLNGALPACAIGRSSGITENQFCKGIAGLAVLHIVA
jgi:hypothetical protein